MFESLGNNYWKLEKDWVSCHKQIYDYLTRENEKRKHFEESERSQVKERYVTHKRVFFIYIYKFIYAIATDNFKFILW